MKLKTLVLLTLLSVFIFLNPVSAKAVNYADYQPTVLGSYWTYQNAADPVDIYTVTVFEQFLFDGNTAVKIGTDSNNYAIGYNDGSVLNIYASVDGGILNNFDDISIGEFTDGTFFNLVEPSNFALLRMWDNLDPAIKSVYGIDPTLNNLVLWATYDSNFSANSHNSIVESNLGISIPDYAVTHLEWYAQGIGEIVDINIDAQSGDIGNRYELIDYNIAPEPVSYTLFIVGGAVLGFGCLRKRKRGKVKN